MRWSTELLESYNILGEKLFLRETNLKKLLGGEDFGKFVDPYLNGNKGTRSPYLEFDYEDSEIKILNDIT